MATPEEIYAKVLSDEKEKVAFSQAFATVEGAREYLAQHGCDATPEEFVAFLREKAPQLGELSDEELGEASGGKWCWWLDTVLTLATAGIACAMMGVFSLVFDPMEGYDLGGEDEKKSALCTHPPKSPANVNGPIGPG